MGRRPQNPNALSELEREVWELLYLSNDQIATLLGVTTSAIEQRFTKIKRKLKAQSRVGCVVQGQLKLGLVIRTDYLEGFPVELVRVHGAALSRHGGD